MILLLVWNSIVGRWEDGILPRATRATKQHVTISKWELSIHIDFSSPFLSTHHIFLFFPLSAAVVSVLCYILIIIITTTTTTIFCILLIIIIIMMIYEGRRMMMTSFFITTTMERTHCFPTGTTRTNPTAIQAHHRTSANCVVWS